MHNIAVVILNFRTPKLALECLGALERERRGLPGMTAMLIDGCSGDDSVLLFEAHVRDRDLGDWVTVVPLAINGGFGWANNQGIKRLMQSSAPPEFIYILNPDALPEPGAILKLADAMRNEPDVGAVGSQLFEPDGRKAGSAFRFPNVATEFFRGAATPALERLFGSAPLMTERDKSGPVDWVVGASLMLRTEALKQCGLFDDGFFLYYEEVELMHRMRRIRWRTWFEPASRVVHIGGASTGVSVGSEVNPGRRPDYWFASRRRMFALVHGRQAALFGSIAWIAGHGLYRLRELVGRRRPGAYAPHELDDLLRLGLRAKPSDVESAAGRWDDPLDVPPAWARTAAQ